MASIAIIGADGAGKTTITRMLLDSARQRFKYIYMGINLESSNFALPTWRLVRYLKRKLDRHSRENKWEPSSTAHSRKGRPRGRLWNAARLINLLAEEWYRQLLSWGYEVGGYVVLYDRHFVFDFADGGNGSASNDPLSARLHRWCLHQFYPRPDLVVYLDAPPEVLYARKPEWTFGDLTRKRESLIRQAARARNFVVVDATQPLEVVFGGVSKHIEEFLRHGGQTQPEIDGHPCRDLSLAKQTTWRDTVQCPGGLSRSGDRAP